MSQSISGPTAIPAVSGVMLLPLAGVLAPARGTAAMGPSRPLPRTTAPVSGLMYPRAGQSEFAVKVFRRFDIGAGRFEDAFDGFHELRVVLLDEVA